MSAESVPQVVQDYAPGWALVADHVGEDEARLGIAHGALGDLEFLLETRQVLVEARAHVEDGWVKGKLLHVEEGL